MSKEGLATEMVRLLDAQLGPKVYAIQIGDAGPIKVGVAINLSRRMWTLQTACPWQLQLRAHWLAAWSSESIAHDALARHRIRGEWFEPHRFVLSYIKNRNGGGYP